MFGPAVRWTTASLGILAIEFGAIVLILGGTLLLQSRKKDFL
jgi:hypothetical protein